MSCVTSGGEAACTLHGTAPADGAVRVQCVHIAASSEYRAACRVVCVGQHMLAASSTSSSVQCVCSTAAAVAGNWLVQSCLQLTDVQSQGSACTSGSASHTTAVDTYSFHTALHTLPLSFAALCTAVVDSQQLQRDMCQHVELQAVI